MHVTVCFFKYVLYVWMLYTIVMYVVNTHFESRKSLRIINAVHTFIVSRTEGIGVLLHSSNRRAKLCSINPVCRSVFPHSIGGLCVDITLSMKIQRSELDLLMKQCSHNLLRRSVFLTNIWNIQRHHVYNLFCLFFIS
jgi:hypothetical protein